MVYYHQPVYYWYEPVYYYQPVYRVYYTPTYVCPPWRSTVSYTSVTSSMWSGSTVTTTTTTYNPLPSYEIVDFCDAVASTEPIVYSTPRVVEVSTPAFEPTIYRSEALAGVLGWGDTPEAIVGAVGAVSPNTRSTTAGEFLGRVPAGGWDVGFEDERVVNGERQLWFRALNPNSRGQRVLIVLRPKSAYPKLYAGQRVMITGRLEEICVDDPFEQAGRLTLAEGSIRG